MEKKSKQFNCKYVHERGVWENGLQKKWCVENSSVFCGQENENVLGCDLDCFSGGLIYAWGIREWACAYLLLCDKHMSYTPWFMVKNLILNDLLK